MSRDNTLTLFVIVLLHFMDSAIYLNNKAYLIAEEISDESIQYLLSAEMKTHDIIVSYHLPEYLFRRGHLLSEAPCLRQFIAFNLLS